MKLGDARRQLKIQFKKETLLETPDPPAQPEKSRLAKDKEPAPQSSIVAQSNGPPASSFWQRFFQVGTQSQMLTVVSAPTLLLRLEQNNLCKNPDLEGKS